MRYVDRYSSPLGWITLAADGAALTGLWIEGQKYAGDVSGYRQEPLPVFDETKRWLDVYFRGEDPGPVPPLAPAGTAFRQAVWGVLAAIPYGQTMTYGQISRILAQQRGSSSPRAVGSAVGHNPISILIPCHRVVGAGGTLTGYAGGLERKRKLLALERGER